MAKTNMRATSLQAFECILPSLQDRELLVLKALKKIQPANNLMLSRYIGLPINCITGRIFSLRKYKLVLFYKKARCPYTNKLTIFWKIPDWINGVLV